MREPEVAWGAEEEAFTGGLDVEKRRKEEEELKRDKRRRTKRTAREVTKPPMPLPRLGATRGQHGGRWRRRRKRR